MNTRWRRGRVNAYRDAVARLKVADDEACKALLALVKPGDRVTWSKGRGQTSGVVLSVNAAPHTHATVHVRSDTGKEYSLNAFWITDELIKGSGR